MPNPLRSARGACGQGPRAQGRHKGHSCAGGSMRYLLLAAVLQAALAAGACSGVDQEYVEGEVQPLRGDVAELRREAEAQEGELASAVESLRAADAASAREVESRIEGLASAEARAGERRGGSGGGVGGSGRGVRGAIATPGGGPGPAGAGAGDGTGSGGGASDGVGGCVGGAGAVRGGADGGVLLRAAQWPVRSAAGRCEGVGVRTRPERGMAVQDEAVAGRRRQGRRRRRRRRRGRREGRQGGARAFLGGA